MDSTKISKTLQKRLPAYLSYLKTLPGECNVSATTIAGALGLGEVQVRKDLAKVSSEGRCRTGRSRDRLVEDIEKYLSCTCATASVIVGDSTLGDVLLDTSAFRSAGIHIMAYFDMNPARKRTETGKPVYSMNRLESFCKCYDVRIGIIAVPAESAQAVCDGLIACGVPSIWNLAPVQLKVPSYVALQSENGVFPRTLGCM